MKNALPVKTLGRNGTLLGCEQWKSVNPFVFNARLLLNCSHLSKSTTYRPWQHFPSPQSLPPDPAFQPPRPGSPGPCDGDFEKDAHPPSKNPAKPAQATKHKGLITLRFSNRPILKTSVTPFPAAGPHLPAPGFR